MSILHATAIRALVLLTLLIGTAAAGKATGEAATRMSPDVQPAAAPSPLWGDLEPGPHAVGFFTIERHDPSRPFRYPFDLEGKPRAIEVTRPLQVSVWYPAAASTQPPMKLADYIELMSAEQDFTVAPAERRRRGEENYFAFECFRGTTPEQRQRVLAMPTAAVRDAMPLPGPFPVILWSLGSPALYQASAEYLASHGYVVAILPRLPPTLAPVDNSPTPPDYDAKTRDLDALIAILSKVPAANGRRIGVTGFSAGGRWAMAEAMRNPNVRAMVSLDSVMLFGDDGGAFAGMPFYDPDRVRIPVLHLVRDEFAKQESSPLWAAMRYADRTRVVFGSPVLQHLDFSSAGLAATLVGMRPEARAEVARTFTAWHHATLWAFDAALRDDAAARARLADLPTAWGLPAGAVTATREAALPAPIGDQIVESLTDDFPRALGLYREQLATLGHPPVDERMLNLAAYQLLRSGQPGEAMQLFELNAEAYPSSPNVYDSLADACEATGDRERALTLSRKVLELLASDVRTAEPRKAVIRTSAEQRIARLSARPGR